MKCTSHLIPQPAWEGMTARYSKPCLPVRHSYLLFSSWCLPFVSPSFFYPGAPLYEREQQQSPPSQVLKSPRDCFWVEVDNFCKNEKKHVYYSKKAKNTFKNVFLIQEKADLKAILQLSPNTALPDIRLNICIHENTFLTPKGTT